MALLSPHFTGNRNYEYICGGSVNALKMILILRKTRENA